MFGSQLNPDTATVVSYKYYCDRLHLINPILVTSLNGKIIGKVTQAINCFAPTCLGELAWRDIGHCKVRHAYDPFSRQWFLLAAQSCSCVHADATFHIAELSSSDFLLLYGLRCVQSCWRSRSKETNTCDLHDHAKS